MEEKRLTRTKFSGIQSIPKYFNLLDIADLLESEDLLEKVSGRIVQKDKTQLELNANGQTYKFQQKQNHGGHRLGDGGEFENILLLQQNKRPLLASQHFISYGTYTDDSMDYEIESKETTFLLTRDDFALAVFERMKK
ncbi:hypothetical protein HN832_01405 [archaeon]|jgi:hypothetical protein|nr:hypothetical protein [archaeon]MBT4373960.1 hypothetical protein [archaeon]MBT4532353.1 hypothetical protein [archaeon]MBT7001939.1 hypothetical protein [archaeon]MBT7282048.1 hypothetical protein [archaeon]